MKKNLLKQRIKELEEENKKLESRLSFNANLLESANDMIYRYEIFPQRRFSYVSSSATGISGYTPEDFYNDPLLGLKMVHPNDKHIFEEITANEDESNDRMVLRWVKKDGGIVWTEHSLKYHFDDQKNLLAIDGVARDTTDEKNIDRLLIKEKQISDSIIHNTPAGIAFLDFDFRLVKFNKIYGNYLAEYSPYGQKGARGKSFFDYVPGSRQQMEPIFTQVRDRAEEFHDFNYKLEINNENGKVTTYWDTSVVPVKDYKGNITGILILCRDVTDKQNAIDALTHSEEQFRALFDASPDAIIQVDPQGTIVFTNNHALKLHGFESLDDFRRFGNNNAFDFIIPDERAQAVRVAQNRLISGEISSVYYTMLRKNGSTFPAELTSSVMRNSKGTPTGFVIIYRDISKRKEAGEKLRNSEELFSKAFHSGPLLMSISAIDDGTYLEVNENYIATTGFSREEIIGKTSVNTGFISKSDRSRMAKLLKEDGRVSGLELELQKKSGEKFWCKYYGEVISVDGKERLLSIAQDITEQKKAKDDLQISEAKFRQIFESAGDAIMVVDKKATVIEVNQAFTKITGISKEEVINKSGFDLARKFAVSTSVPGLFKIIKNFIAGQTGDAIELKIKDKILEISTSLIRNDKYAVGILRDITAEKKAGQALVESEKKYRHLIETTSEGFWLISPDRITLDVNDSLCKMLGFTKEEMIGKSPVDFFDKTDRETLASQMSQIPDRLHRTYQLTARQKNGNSLDLLFNATTLFDDHGKVTGAFAMVKDITMLKKNERALQESYTDFNTFFNSIDDFLFILDENGIIQKVNATVINRLGYSHEELKNQPILLIHPQNMQGEVLKTISEILKGVTKLCNVPIVTKDGQLIHVETVINKGTWSGKEALFVVSKDISSLKLSEDKFSRLFHSSPAIVGLSDLETGEYLEVNQTFYDKLGFEPNEVIGHNAKDLVRMDSGFRDLSLSALKEKGVIRNVETTIFTKNGEALDVLLSADIIRVHDKKFIYTTAIDITERKKAERELTIAKEIAQINELKYRTIFENAPIGIFRSTKKGKFIEVNQSLAKMLGYQNPQEVIESIDNISEQIYVASDKRTKILENISHNIVEKFENEYRRRNGEHFYANLFLKEIKDENGNDILEGMVEETTERRKYEDDLKKAKEKAEESDRLKSAFLANMSHEIRTPMNGILGFADLLNEPDLTGEEQIKYVGIIEKSGERMLNIINDLMDISKIEAGQMEVKFTETNIHDQAEYLCTFFKPEMEKKGLELFTHFQVKDAPPTFWTDREKLYAIITNLLKNAIKYTNEGSIEFGYRFYQDGKSVQTPDRASIPDQKNHQDENNSVQTPDRASLSNHQASLSTHQKDHPSQPNRSMLQFYVKDTGIGIPQDRLEAVFERFIQADIEDKKAQEGAGLGLAISKAYVEMLGGKIWVESHEGAGSTFYFTIEDKAKTEQSSNPEKMKVEHKEEIKTRQLKILVAEDDENSRLHLSIVLAPLATEIIYATTGTEAVELCRENPDLDLVLMDIKMPGLNGYDATREIRKFNKDIVIIAQTAYALAGDREKSIGAGCNDYITKPLKVNVLQNLISKYNIKAMP